MFLKMIGRERQEIILNKDNMELHISVATKFLTPQYNYIFSWNL